MHIYEDVMVSQKNNSSCYLDVKDIAAQYVNDALKRLGDNPMWIITTRRMKSGAFCAQTVTTAWSEGILMLPYSEEQQTT